MPLTKENLFQCTLQFFDLIKNIFGCFCPAGTFISAFTVLCGARSELISERGVCCVFWLNVAAALIQILTAVIMVGWIMSIFWGMDMVILASQYITCVYLSVWQFLLCSLLLSFFLFLSCLLFFVCLCLTHVLQWVAEFKVDPNK